jgi:exoribonuclease R
MDLRKERIFTIDPLTARDLDDALSISPLTAEGTHRVGVHIADVTYFVKPKTHVDFEAQRRATTIYLVHKVLPMLPHVLSSHLCSLNPGEDRLAFSVFWEMTPDGKRTQKKPTFARVSVAVCVCV